MVDVKENTHILFLLGSLRAGGAERVILQIAEHMVYKNYQVTFLHLNGNEHFYNVNNRINQVTLDLTSRSANFIQGLLKTRKRVAKIRQSIKKINPDILISFFTDVNVLTILANRKLQIPLVISERNNPYEDEIPRQWKLGRKLFYNKTDKLVLQTEQVRAFYNYIDQSKIEVIPNPLRKLHLAENENERVILAVGRLVHQKGMDMLIHAYSMTQAKDSWKLNILGEGKDFEKLREMVVHLQLEDKVEFLGNRKDIDVFYQQASMFVLSSRYEGFPNVLAEAMGSGLPCISFDCNYGPSELIENQKNGLLVETGNVDSLAENIDMLAFNESKRHKMGEEAQKICKKLDKDIIMRKWEELFKSLANN